jgi:hypothetical protein
VEEEQGKSLRSVNSVNALDSNASKPAERKIARGVVNSSIYALRAGARFVRHGFRTKGGGGDLGAAPEASGDSD